MANNSRQTPSYPPPIKGGRRGGINISTTILLIIILSAFVFGIIRLFIMRFDTGDVYPVYSSLRSDPLGTKIFYECLNNLSSITASRNYQTLSKLRNSQASTIFYFGLREDSLNYVDRSEITTLETLAYNGNRLIILFYPENKKKKEEKQIEEKGQGKDSDTENKKAATPNKECRSCRISLKERWGFDLNYDETYVGKKTSGLLVADTYNLPETISWHSVMYFDRVNGTPLNPPLARGDLRGVFSEQKWSNIYTLNEHPVIIERNFGKGKIILATDTCFVSNEALQKERYSELLAWLVGNNKKVIFDETHFGISENPGIAALSRQYRLHGFFAGVILLGLLFIWKNSLSLVPPYDEDSAGEVFLSTGKDYISGFISLLRRNVKSNELLTACLKEWKKTFHYKLKDMGDEIRQIHSIIESDKKLPTREQDPLNAYKQISKILAERKKR